MSMPQEQGGRSVLRTMGGNLIRATRERAPKIEFWRVRMRGLGKLALRRVYQFFPEVERGVAKDRAIAGVATAEDADPAEPFSRRRRGCCVAHRSEGSGLRRRPVRVGDGGRR